MIFNENQNQKSQDQLYSKHKENTIKDEKINKINDNEHDRIKDENRNENKNNEYDKIKDEYINENNEPGNENKNDQKEGKDLNKNDDNEEERIEDDNKKRNEDNANIETINEKNIKSKFSNDLSYPFVKTFHFQSQPNQSKYSDLISIFNKEKECPDREQYKLNLLIPFGLDPKQYRDNDSYVLVLGSGGLIGSALEKILRDHGYKTLHVLSRHHLDLRIPGSLNIFNNINISFVYFLAYEVGGAKFLQVPEYQEKILKYNIQITNNVFSWLFKRKIRFAFASSSLTADKSNYGYVKRLGENFTFSKPKLGRVFKLWNAYGFEFPGPKSHAIPDFIFQGLYYKKIKTLTTGEELRQFTHVIDISKALIAIMEHFDEAPLEIDISDGNWLKLCDIAKEVQKCIGDCELILSNKTAKVQKRCEANLTSSWHQTRWHQEIQLSEGINNIIQDMQKYIDNSLLKPSVTFIINCKEGISDQTLKNICSIVYKIDEMSANLVPMQIEIIAATKLIQCSERAEFPCTILIGEDDYLMKAIEYSHSDVITIMDPNVIPTMTHLYFFQRIIPRDLIFYFSEKQMVNTINDTYGQLNSSLAKFQINTDCEVDEQNLHVKNINDFSFVVATKETWLAVRIPSPNINLHDWIMRLKCGYISIQFESPVFCWKYENENEIVSDNSNQYKIMLNDHNNNEVLIIDGKRPLIK